jgi:opacity protein-like surface antigen
MRSVAVSLVAAVFIFHSMGGAIASAKEETKEKNEPFNYIQAEGRLWLSIGESNWRSFTSTAESELEYKNIDAPIALTTLRVKPGPKLFWLTLEGAIGIGNIDSGKEMDIDSSIVGVTSDTEADIDGDIEIIGGKIAIRFYPWDEKSSSYIDGIFGYIYQKEKLNITDGVQIVPNTGPFGGLDSSYEFRWESYPLGLRGKWSLIEEPRPFLYDISLAASGSVGRISYQGEGILNLRTDLAQDPSFKHETNEGYAVFAEGGVIYQPVRYISIGVGYQFSQFMAWDGTETTFNANGTETKRELDKVETLRYGSYLFISAQF